jgi:pyruvate dehydrogenase E2 component (dihydrolipoamide acetyltransferase)
MAEVVMPRLSDSMEEGTILTWLKQVGDEIAVGDELVEIETDKANMAYEADVAGTLTEILAQEGETLPIGSPIARIGDSNGEGPSAQSAGPVAGDGGALRAGSSSTPPSPTPPAEGAEDSSTEEAQAGQGGAPVAAPEAPSGERVKASPLAKRLAKERGLDLRQLQGSGPGGRIVKADVESAVSPAGDAVAGVPRGAEDAKHPSTVGDAAAAGPAGQTAKGDVVYQEPSKLQATVARRMAESKATAPHFYLSTEVDMSKAVEARAALKASAKEGDVVPSLNDMVVKAAAIALREFPKANGAYRDGRFELYSRVNVGIAVAAEEALVVPTVFDADRKGLRQIASESRALAGKVREGTITPPELSGATFTVSNLGMFGVTSFEAVINSPQAAILSVGAVRETPVVKGGEIVPGHLMSLNLACDHRILYGSEGAEVLARIRALLEEPVGLAL